MTELRNAIVLITGAAGGFGQELTRQLLQAESRLILSDREAIGLQQQVSTLQQTIKSGEVLACLAADLSSAAGCDSLYQQVQAVRMPIDIVINNAGMALYGRMDEVPIADWERLMQVNLLSPMRISSLFAAEMIARRSGHIVNISSIAGWAGAAGLAHYCASKFGLRGFSEGLRDEVRSYGVKVTAVYPFFSRTPILQAKRYGALADEVGGLPENLLTDPAIVMARAIRGIEQNQLHVFPDRIGYATHLCQRFAPWLLDWMNSSLKRRIRRGSNRSPLDNFTQP